MKKYRIGFDIGTESLHSLILDAEGEIAALPDSVFHFGNPVEALQDLYSDIIEDFGYDGIETVAFTGSGGNFIAEALGAPFTHDTITIPEGMHRMVPEADYVFHIGAKDAYYFEMERVNSGNGRKIFTPDHGTGTKCGGGSGILITKQCRRFFENLFPVTLGESRRDNRLLMQERLEKVYRRAEEEISKTDKELSVGGRCGVVIQSDMIHLQNRGENIRNILNGMYRRVIKNYRTDVLKTRTFKKDLKGVVSGGIFKNRVLVEMLKNELGIEIIVPDRLEAAGALGAIIKAGKSRFRFRPGELNEAAGRERGRIEFAPSLKSSLKEVEIFPGEEVTAVREDLRIYTHENGRSRDVVIGLDGGSTTTKAIIAETGTLKIIGEICLYTNGKPLETAQEIFRQIDLYLGERIKVRGVAYTGSSGSFYHRLFTDAGRDRESIDVDRVKDEITCHALGVRHYNNDVDTVFELGGQDAKFTLFNPDGSVKKSKMNLSCMAGTGQTMQNMVEMLGLDINSTFHQYALNAERTPVVDDTCGVFTEAGIAKLIALGFPREEVAAAIVYGFMGGYVNKFIGNEQFGSFASAQGGPFNGESCLAALAMLTGMKIHAFPHRQLFGALGAAIAVNSEIERCAREGVDFTSRFRGLGIHRMKFKPGIEQCNSLVKDSCGMKDCVLQVFDIDGDPVFSGGACPKGNTGSAGKKAPDYIGIYRGILEKHLSRYSSRLDNPCEEERVLIPRSLTFLNEKGVFYTALYKSLGFDVALSPESDDGIVEDGIKYSHSETCFPVKLAHGHAARLKEKMRPGLDRILLVNALGVGSTRFCPYVAGDGFLTKEALNIENSHALLPVIHFENPDQRVDKTVYNDLKRVFGSRFSMNRVRAAFEKAREAEEDFLREIQSTGEKIVSSLKRRNEKIYLAIGRGYTLFDDMASSRVHELFASNGMHFLPSFFLKNPDTDIEEISENMYWYQGRRIINYSLLTAMDPLMFPVRETNFNCGTDSMIIYHEEFIFNRAEKPHLVLQTDGHSSNAQFGTRALANNEVVNDYKQKILERKDFQRGINNPKIERRIVGIPYMGENSYMIAASLRSIGVESEVMKTRTEEANRLARKFVTSNACSPFSFQVGDCLAWLYELQERGIDPNVRASIFQPMAKGPCRFGQYYVLLRNFVDENGFTGVGILSPDSDKDYSNIPINGDDMSRLIRIYFKGTFCNDLLEDTLLRVRPYEKVPGSAEKLYTELALRLVSLVETGAETEKLVNFMGEAAPRYHELMDSSVKRKPLVVMNGEIFVRSHPEANQHSIKLLEKYGLEVKLASLNQWFEYTNKKSIRQYRKSREWKNLLKAWIKRQYMKKTGAKIAAPFRKLLEGREGHDTDHMINCAQEALIYDKLITGESPLTIGEAHMFARGELRGVSGIYHVGPFGCMHETAATSQIQSLTQKQRAEATTSSSRIIPFMDAVFGDSELSNLEAEIAAFAEKCYIKQEISEKENRY